MSDPGRNDPCPCGSGKKYKRCCLRKERGLIGLPTPAAPRTGFDLPPEVVAEARRADLWQADLLPIPTALSDEPESRPTALLVTAGELVVSSEILGRPSGEPAEIAALLAGGLEAAAEALGSRPRAVWVRHDSLVDDLSDRLGDPWSSVRIEAGALPELDATADALCRALAGSGRPFSAAPQTWTGWGLPGDRVERLFAAAAAFYRARPWEAVADSDPILVTLGERDWIASVLGAGGIEWGLGLYAEDDDFELFQSGDPEQVFLLGDRVLSLTFDRARDLPVPMRREIREAGLEVAGPTAFPRLMVINSPGGGISRRDAEDLERGLRLLTEIAEEGTLGAVAAGETWLDPDGSAEAVGLAPSFLWDEPELLEPGSARGTGAEPEAAIRWDLDGGDVRQLWEEELALAAGFEEWLLDEGFAESTAAEHRRNATLLVEFLIHDSHVPVRALHECDLRLFLFEHLPRTLDPSRTRVTRLPVSLERFFDYLMDAHDIECPWAWDLLADREAITGRWEAFPDEEGPAFVEWYLDLAHDIDRRALFAAPGLGDDANWPDASGAEIDKLHHELHRRWLLWRDELLHDGPRHPDEIRPELEERQYRWETTPHPQLGGRTPYEVVTAQAER